MYVVRIHNDFAFRRCAIKQINIIVVNFANERRLFPAGNYIKQGYHLYLQTNSTQIDVCLKVNVPVNNVTQQPLRGYQTVIWGVGYKITRRL